MFFPSLSPISLSLPFPITSAVKASQAEGLQHWLNSFCAVNGEGDGTMHHECRLGHRAEWVVGEGPHSSHVLQVWLAVDALSCRSQAENSKESVDISVALRRDVLRGGTLTGGELGRQAACLGHFS